MGKWVFFVCFTSMCACLGDDDVISACTTDTVRVRVHAAHDAAGSRRHRRLRQHVPMRDCEQDEQQSDGEPAAPRPPLHSSANTYLRYAAAAPMYIYLAQAQWWTTVPCKIQECGRSESEGPFLRQSFARRWRVTRGRSPLISRWCHHFQASRSIQEAFHSTAASVCQFHLTISHEFRRARIRENGVRKVLHVGN